MFELLFQQSCIFQNLEMSGERPRLHATQNLSVMQYVDLRLCLEFNSPY